MVKYIFGFDTEGGEESYPWWWFVEQVFSVFIR